ncbi:UNVERIFIED_CONTAM: hypothetical protein Sangu_1086100 [Sesamum angustifolium]|uniref:non-specific serine/threonine protein kinase n=1 Tax=Sesamum angustifolium TaxID=2727405 RepID=A0AAW2NZ95_9LAMI
MAPRPHHLPFLSVFITSFSIFTNGNSVNPPPSTCAAAFDCGNGLTLRYPFWPQTQQPIHCGYPNFSVSCTNSQPVLHIANHPFHIKSINSSENTLIVAYGEASSTTSCPIMTHDFTLESTPSLNYTKDNKILHFYYNCTVYPPSVHNIKCLQRGAKHSYAFVNGSVPEFDWPHHCESSITVPVIGKAVDGLVANGSGDALREGFKLAWKTVDSECQLCEASGGFCGYSSNKSNSVDPNFFCFCSDGQHLKNCHVHNGEISIKSPPNYLAIGAVICGGLLVISIVAFFINKKKTGGGKSGFSQIPNTYGK